MSNSAAGSSSAINVYVTGFRNVDSAAIQHLMYVPDLNMLEVTFRRTNSSRNVYQYWDFKSEHYVRLLEAYKLGESLGGYFHSQIRGNFPVSCLVAF